MKVSLRWMAEYVDLPTTDPEEIATIFGNLGHEVEGYELLEPQFTDVFVGRVLSVQAHPNADKVRLCSVDTGNGPTDIVCGAWNFEAGAVVPVAVPGAVLGSDFVISQREIRGVTSHGMICSSAELGLGDDADGIMVLDEGLAIGSPFLDHVELPDVVFDLAITPNRPDAMSMVGLARELAAHFEIAYRIPTPDIAQTVGETTLKVEIQDERCRRFVAREVAGVTIGNGPLWMSQRLLKAGIRSISNVVDTSNYVMLELGQPTHAFDRDRVADGHVIVRAAADSETLVTLDDVERHLSPADLVVADPSSASSLAGTMGGAASEVSESTTNVLVECAAWDPPTIMAMSRRHGLRSEASSRFERGVDPNLPPLAADRMAELIALVAGGTVVGGTVDVYPAPVEPLQIELPVSEVARILGIDLSAAQVAGLLERLDLVSVGDDVLAVTVPTNRPDLTRPVDLIEEVARLYGFDNFPSRVPSGTDGGLSSEQKRIRRVRNVMRGLGFSEAHTSSFHGRRDLDMLGLPGADRRARSIEVKNPLREEESLLRSTLLPGLLQSVRFNTGHGAASVALFEVGKVFFDEESPELGVVPDQPDMLGFVAVGELGPADLAGSARAVDVYTATAVFRSIVEQMGLGSAEVLQAEVPGLHPGRGAFVALDGNPVGYVGELHPAVARAFDFSGRVVVGEFDVEPLVADPGLWAFQEPSVYPPSEFDLSFDAPIDLGAGEIASVARTAAGSLVESVRMFDEFIRDGVKAVGFRFGLRAADRTLTAEDVTAVREAIVEAVRTETGATLRGA